MVYGDLVRRYREDTAFAQVVNGVATGLGLRVLDVSAAGGVVLAAAHESVFEIRMETYARQAKIRERRDMEKVLHGIVHLAVAALAFPRPADLANDTYVGRVTVEQVDLMVREACRILDERAALGRPVRRRARAGAGLAGLRAAARGRRDQGRPRRRRQHPRHGRPRAAVPGRARVPRAR